MISIPTTSTAFVHLNELYTLNVFIFAHNTSKPRVNWLRAVERNTRISTFISLWVRYYFAFVLSYHQGELLAVELQPQALRIIVKLLSGAVVAQHRQNSTGVTDIKY